MLSSFVIYVVIIKTLIELTTAENKTILAVPKPGSSGRTWKWSLSGKQPIPWTEKSNPKRYLVCDDDDNNAWLRSNEFQVGDAKRVDVTVKYAASNCSGLSGYKNCKVDLKLFVHKAATIDTSTDLFGYNGPNPETNGLFEQFGTTNPKVLTLGYLGKPENIETFSFNTSPTKSYYYLAIQYTGGCFALYGITISYSVCPSLALSASLVKLPQTTSPANGSIQVSGSCANHAQPMNKTLTLYGYCKADGEWSTNMYSGECWCDAGYGKYSVGSGAECKECPSKTYQNSPSNSKCKDCPMNSVQDTDRTKCKCQPRFYRTEKESISDNCTAQPSAPEGLKSTFFNATFMALQWSPPANLGGRLDVYYEVECKQCNEKGQDCTKDCTGTVITHTPSTTRMATVKHLSVYTYYQITVFAKNGVTSVAEKNNEESAYSVLPQRTKETIPGIPIVAIKVLNATSVILSWTLQERNGAITYYKVTYYPTGEESEKKVVNVTKSKVTIAGLIEEKKYIFQVRASTSIGLGPPGNTTKIVAVPRKDGQEPTANKNNDSEGNSHITVPILATIVCLAVLIFAAAIIAVYIKRKGLLHQGNTHAEHGNVVSKTESGNAFQEGNVNLQEISLEELPCQTDDLYALVTDNMLWEVPRENLSVIKRLGSGNFGYVDKALAIGLPRCPGQVTVAVKSLKENAQDRDKEDFLTELLLMKKIEPHPRIVKLMGCCTNSDGPMSIILEYLPYGDLLGYLRRSRGHEDTCCSGDRRPEGRLSSDDLLMFGWMISDGMKFLAENKCVHRDLAARNVLVGENKLCKISDLGLARTITEDVYNRSRAARLPIKWMPPESIFFGTSSIASDVWSYGIVLWEIFTLGDSPYPNYKGKEVPRLLQKGYRMPKPGHLSTTLYSLMLRCWEEKPEDRPSFSSICDEINSFYGATKDYINLNAFDDALYVNFDVQ